MEEEEVEVAGELEPDLGQGEGVMEAGLQGEDGEVEDENKEDGGGGGIRGKGEVDAQEVEYRFEFRGGMDPVDIVEAEAIEVEPYRLFERLEYEALADRKRKAFLQPHRGDECTKKPRKEDTFGANFDEILEALNHSFRRKSRQPKRRGRRKGFKKRLSPEITRKLGDATLYYATGRYDEAIQLLKDVLRLAPNLSDVYHTLGLIYNAVGDRKKALTYYMFAAHLAPKDPSLWKLLVSWSIEQGNTGQARHCLRKAIKADPENVGLKFDYALL